MVANYTSQNAPVAEPSPLADTLTQTLIALRHATEMADGLSNVPTAASATTGGPLSIVSTAGEVLALARYLETRINDVAARLGASL